MYDAKETKKNIVVVVIILLLLFFFCLNFAMNLITDFYLHTLQLLLSNGNHTEI